MSKSKMFIKNMIAKRSFADKVPHLSDHHSSKTCSFIGDHNGDHYLLHFTFDDGRGLVPCRIEMRYTERNPTDVSGIKFEQRIWITVEDFLKFNTNTINDIIKQFHQTVDYHQNLDKQWRILEAELMQVGEKINQLEQNNHNTLIRMIND